MNGKWTGSYITSSTQSIFNFRHGEWVTCKHISPTAPQDVPSSLVLWRPGFCRSLHFDIQDISSLTSYATSHARQARLNMCWRFYIDTISHYRLCIQPVSHCLTAPHIAGGAGSSVLLHKSTMLKRMTKLKSGTVIFMARSAFLIDIFPNISLSTVLHRLNLELMLVLDETSWDVEKKVTGT